MDLNSGWTKVLIYCRWVYDNITIVVGVILFIDTVVLFSGKGGVLTAILNLIALVVFGLRLLNEYKNTEERQ